MDQDKINAYQYTFRHDGMLPPLTDPELEKEIKSTWNACKCSSCKTPCIHIRKTERFPRFIYGGKGQCANLIKESGEPYTWVDEITGEVHSIPKSIIAKIREDLKNEQ